VSVQEVSDKTQTDAARPDAPMPQFRLVHKAGDAGGAAFEPIRLHPGVTFLGRVQENDVQLKSELVSRRHAKIILTDMGVTVHDLDSHNGVFLNGKKVRSTPVQQGDLVYFADICCTLEPDDGPPSPDSFQKGVNESSLVVDAAKRSRSDDPAVRNLGALIRATDLVLGADEEAFYSEVVQLCRELTDSDVAVLVRRQPDGELATPVVLREAGAPRGEVPVAWPVAEKCVKESLVLFTEDAEADPLIPGDEAGARGAIMCVPILVDGRGAGAIWLARKAGGTGFSDREVETVSAIGHLVGTRFAGRKRPEDMDTAAGSPLLSDTSEEASRAEVDRISAELAEARAAAVKAKEESDTAKGHVSKLEETLRLVDTKHKETLERMRADMRSLDEQLSPLRAEQEASALQLAAAKNEMQRLQAELAKRGEEDSGSAGLEAAVAEAVGGRMLMRLKSIAGGEATPDAFSTTPITAVCFGMAGADGWATTASPDEVKQRLETFAATVRDEVKKHSGVVEQVFGHLHLAVFGGDGAGALRALQCAAAVVKTIPQLAVQAGVHMGTRHEGLFGSGAAAASVSLGEAVAVARGAAEYSPGSAVVVTETVRSQISPDTGMMLAALGPALIRGMPAPVNLYQLAGGAG
jgi:class 3 adenylate cyclase